MSLPPCGLYRTTAEVAGIPTGRLVYFHNHGDPGPGIYLPAKWEHNRARFEPRGHTLKEDGEADGLVPLHPEGLYSVTEAFWCCTKHCRRYEPDTLVQLGYNGTANAILFLPALGEQGITVPERGTRIDDDAMQHLRRLHVASASASVPSTPSGLPN